MTTERPGSEEQRRKELTQETTNLLAGINVATGANFNDALQYWDIIEQGL